MLVKNEKICKFGSIYPDILFNHWFCMFWDVLYKYINVKNFLLRGKDVGVILPPCSPHLRILYYLTTAIINKCFKFQNDWLEKYRISCNCTWFLSYTSVLKISKISNSRTSEAICMKIQSVPIYIKIQINMKFRAISF